jgi:hypothetical protein
MGFIANKWIDDNYRTNLTTLCDENNVLNDNTYLHIIGKSFFSGTHYDFCNVPKKPLYYKMTSTGNTPSFRVQNISVCHSPGDQNKTGVVQTCANWIRCGGDGDPSCTNAFKVPPGDRS